MSQGFDRTPKYTVDNGAFGKRAITSLTICQTETDRKAFKTGFGS